MSIVSLFVISPDGPMLHLCIASNCFKNTFYNMGA